MSQLEIRNLHVALEDGTEIVKGVDLEVDLGEKHAIMGPNGSGKSTLAYALMGHPAYEVTEGQILFDGVDLTELGADERAQRGLFLAFQYPHAIPGVTVTSFLRSAINAKRKAAGGGEDDPVPIPEFRTNLLAAMEELKVPRELASRYLNDGFSGGEKKRVEILQMAMLKPKIAVLDETDSGLDIDALKIVANGVNSLVGPEIGALVITHYQRILDYVTPDFVHVFVDGRIVADGGPSSHTRSRPTATRRSRQPVLEAAMSSTHETDVVREIRSDYKYGFSNPDDAKDYFFKSGRGISHEVVEAIAEHKAEPDWMRKFRHKSLDYFFARPMPNWGADLSGIDFENIYYYIKPTEKQADSWEDLPAEILDTWDKLGIPEAEKKYLAGVGAQYESEVVYHKLQADLEAKGVIFLDMDTALREHEDIVKQYMGTIIPQNDNKFAALNSAVWSGGSFIYVPPGVRIEMPLQAYFRINAENMGQFERTLIIVDEDAYVHYVEGCTAPIYSSDSLHSAVVEIVVKKGGRCRYTTIQNWSNNVYNLVTKRAVAYEGATMEWVDGNLGSKVTMKYPAIWLMGERAHGEVLSIAFGGKGQHQDAGGKVVHVAPRTTSVITSKSISKDGGRAGYRGLLQVAKGAVGSKSKVVCDALILDDESRSDTYPYIQVDESDVDLGHEATVSKIGEEQLFYLMSRGLSEAEATAMIVSGFVEPITKELPLEYAVEMNRLIQLQMEGSVG